MRITFFLPNSLDARYNRKRVDALEKSGIETKILAFKRDYYSGKSFDNDYALLGNVSHGTVQRGLP